MFTILRFSIRYDGLRAKSMTFLTAGARANNRNVVKAYLRFYDDTRYRIAAFAAARRVVIVLSRNCGKSHCRLCDFAATRWVVESYLRFVAKPTFTVKDILSNA